MNPQSKLYSANGLKFEENTNNRPMIRDLGKGEFMIHVGGNHLVINKDDINDLAILLREVKDREYTIEDD